MSAYPTSIISLATHNDGDTVFAADVNTPNAEIVAIETGLLNGFQHALSPLVNIGQSLGASTKRWLKLWTQDLDASGTITNSGYLGVGALLVSNASKAIVEQAALTNGQLLIGSTGAAPAAGAITATGTGLTVTNGPGTIALNLSSRLLDKSIAELAVTNTALLTTVYSFAVPGGTLGTANLIRVTLSGSYTNTSGAGATFQITGSYGGTNFLSGALVTAATATTGGLQLVVLLSANALTNSQRAESLVGMIRSGVTGGVAGGWGIVDTFTAAHESLAVDSTLSQNLVLSVQHGTAATTITFKKYAVTTELLS